MKMRTLENGNLCYVVNVMVSTHIRNEKGPKIQCTKILRWKKRSNLFKSK